MNKLTLPRISASLFPDQVPFISTLNQRKSLAATTENTAVNKMIPISIINATGSPSQEQKSSKSIEKLLKRTRNSTVKGHGSQNRFSSEISGSKDVKKAH